MAERINRKVGGVTSDISDTAPGVGSTSTTPNAFNQMITDASSFSVTLDSGKRNAIQWIVAKKHILIGTTGGEWRMGGSFNKPLTPTNYELKQQTNRGSKDMQPILISDAIAFVNEVGRKLHKLAFNGVSEDYDTPDLSVLAEHITASGITSMAFQRNPDEILWMTRVDGVPLSMTYDPIQNVIAWARHPMGTALAESVAVIPGDGEDEVWFFMKRTVEGSTVRNVERMKPRDWGDDVEDMFFVDSGLTYDGVPTNNFTGLGHLEGETVAILGDGAKFPRQVVTGATLPSDLAHDVSVAQIGLPFTYKLKPMRMDQNTQQGTSKGSIGRFAEAVISFLNTLNAKFGDGTTTHKIPWREFSDDYGDPPALFTGDKVVNISGFSVEDPFQIEGDDPMPCSVRAIIPRKAIPGR